MTYKKVKSILLVILSCLMTVCIFAAFVSKDKAFADRSVTISGSSIFYTSGDAVVWAHEEVFESAVPSDGEGEDDEDGDKYNHDLSEYYSMFVFKSGTDSVNYRKHLAFSWKYNTADENWDKEVDDEEDSEDETEKEEVKKVASLTPADGWFNMEIGFEDSNFENYSFKKFVITFESQQYTQTKDGKTTNYVMFYPNEEKTGVQAVISDDIEQTPAGDEPVLSGHITIKFVRENNIKYENAYTVGPIEGVYNVEVSDSTSTTEGTFENVGGTYAKYSSSTTSPVTPLSFKAEFEEDEDGEEGEEAKENVWAGMVLYSLNGQSFRVGTYSSATVYDEDGNLKVEDFDKNFEKYYVRTEDGRGYVRNSSSTPDKDTKYYTYRPGVSEEDGHYRGGTINDNAPPVICFSSGVTHVGVGKELPFDYQLIDVLASSPSADTYYYMLTNEQAEDADGDFKPDNYADENLFRLVTDSDNQYMEPHKNHYVPTKENIPVDLYDEENFNIVAAVKVYLKLYDTRTDSINQTTYVLLDWFVPNDRLVTVEDKEGNQNKYIAVANDEQGVSFAYTNTSSTSSEEDWKALTDAYQKLVDEAAKDLKAGSKNYFYLPSFENLKYTNGMGMEVEGNLFADNVTAYKDLSFNVYYNNGTNGNTSTQTSSTLAINITKAGRYVFTIYATDKSSNPMYYYKDGEKKTFTASEIWSMRESKADTKYEDTKDYLPWFTFNVEASEIEIEDPGEREPAYVGSKYSSISFDVNAVSYERKYELYRFDNDVYFNDKDGGNGKALTYAEFMEKKADLLEEHPEWFTEIPAANTLTKGSDEYDEFYDYGWNSSSPEFVPQDANTFYVVKLTVSSTEDNREPKTMYMGISASAKIDSLQGEDTWVQDNLTSIILLSIAGASLIGIILLLVIRPKDSGDIDEQYEADKSKKKNK